MKKFYGIMFENYKGEELVDMFYNEEDCENECERLNDECDYEERHYVREMTEEEVEREWGDYKIS